MADCHIFPTKVRVADLRNNILECVFLIDNNNSLVTLFVKDCRHMIITSPLAETDMKPTKTYNALVIEDHRISQKVAQLMLERENCRVEVADRGEKGIEMARQQQFDLIFMDLGLPDIDGIEVTRRIRASQGLSSSAVIIALSAHTDDTIKQQALEAGMNDYLSKPLSTSIIHDLIKKWIASE